MTKNVKHLDFYFIKLRYNSIKILKVQEFGSVTKNSGKIILGNKIFYMSSIKNSSFCTYIFLNIEYEKYLKSQGIS